MQKLTSKGKHAVKVGNHPLQMWYPKLATVGLRWQSGGEDSGDLVFHMLHIQKKKTSNDDNRQVQMQNIGNAFEMKRTVT